MTGTTIDRLRTIIEQELVIDRAKITDHARIVDDLDADSLDVVELTMSIEEEFGIEIDDQDMDQENMTVADIVKLIDRLAG
ncbi:acyl carrier protein [Rhodobacterales bacterium HKCCE4037]|nr:acyl carrier protein [Rhodobacterales bacterium HKCCE4037]